MNRLHWRDAPTNERHSSTVLNLALVLSHSGLEEFLDISPREKRFARTFVLVALRTRRAFLLTDGDSLRETVSMTCR